jgi:hypothetical protein
MAVPRQRAKRLLPQLLAQLIQEHIQRKLMVTR